MPKNEQWSLDELIAILGQPAKEWIAKSQSYLSPEGVQVGTALRLDAPVEGACRIMKWQCTPHPANAQEIVNTLESLRAKPNPSEKEVEAVRTRAMEALNVVADRCIAASWIHGDNNTWVMIRVCSRHAKVGLVEDHTWGRS